MNEVEKLLNVLDQPKYEQALWVQANVNGEPFDPKGGSTVMSPNMYELAFGLRNEAEVQIGHIHWICGKLKVFVYVTGATESISCDRWFIDVAHPIHWIIAALIAKEMAK